MGKYKSKTPLKNLKFDGLKLIKKEDKKYISARAVIYCRVSTKRQVEEGLGLETQEADCKRYCEERGIEVVMVFIEKAESGNRQDRPEFDDCIKYLKEKNKKNLFITHFVCRDLSRISRPDLDDIGQAFFLEKKITDTGVEIVDLSGNNYTENPEGKLLKSVMYSFAGYQRLDSGRKARNAQKARMLEGYWAQPAVPLGYTRTTLSKKEYFDVPDDQNSIIIKQGLEMYANDPTMNNTQLYDFMIEKGLKGNGKGSNKNNAPRRTIIDKMFEPSRLFYYAGYIFYPSWDINEPIDARHEGIIGLDTVQKIINKLQLNVKVAKGKNTEDEFILKQLITCTGCGRKLTGWEFQKTPKEIYYYYGCQKSGCPERANINKQKLESAIVEMIKSVQLPPVLMKLFDAIFEKTWSEQSADWTKEKQSKLNRMQRLRAEKESIERTLMRASLVPSLEQSLNDKWMLYDGEEREIERLIENEDVYKANKRSILKKARDLVIHPLAYWELGDKSLKKLLLEVWFGQTLTYSKSIGLLTTETPSLYRVISEITKKSTGWYPYGESNPDCRIESPVS